MLELHLMTRSSHPSTLFFLSLLCKALITPLRPSVFNTGLQLRLQESSQLKKVYFRPGGYASSRRGPS